MKQNCSFVSVVRDFAMYKKCIEGNPFVKAELSTIDNRTENFPIPVCYNRFLDRYDYSRDSWFVFCHEDFELREDISALLDSWDRNSLHGVVGGVRKGFCGFGMQRVYGNMTETNRVGEAEWNPAVKIKSPVEVEAFDCCCLVVHSSLVAKHHLRFDPNLLFDLYVEDFCAAAKVGYGIRSIVEPVECCHHSGSRATERLYRHLPYLKRKYPKNCFVGTIVYFGTPSWQKRIQDCVMKLFGKDD